MRVFTGILVLFVLFFSCSGISHKVIPEDQFSEILADLNVYDAISENAKLKQSELKGIDSAYLYGYLYRKHGITKEQFDTSLYYYTQHPKQMLKITENTYSIIEKRRVFAQQEDELTKNYRRLWINTDVKKIDGDLGPKKETYIIPIDTTGMIMAKVILRFGTDDKSSLSTIKGFFSKDTLPNSERIDLPEIPVFKSKYSRDYVLMHELDDSSFKYLTLNILENKNTEPDYFRDLDITRVEVCLVANTNKDEESKRADSSATDPVTKETKDGVRAIKPVKK